MCTEDRTYALIGSVSRARSAARAVRRESSKEPDFEFDGDGELDELTSADFGEDPYLHVDT